MARLVTTVHVRDEDGVVSVFGPGDTIPAWAAKKITNPDAWDVADFAADIDQPGAATATADDISIPPKGGKGSGLSKWREYATAKGYEFDANATREDIIDALEADGVPTE